MTAASTSDARKRNTSPVDPAEVVARVLMSGIDCTNDHCSFCAGIRARSSSIVAALRAEGLLA